MKKQILFAALAIVFLNCQNPKAENPAPAPTEVAVEGTLPEVKPTATNSLEYLGIYKGTLPCADCAGIETAIELSEDFTYTMVSTYNGKSAKPFETQGTFRWAADGKTVLLDNGKNQEQFLVGENSLTKLDTEGKKITGKLAERYVLKRISDAAAEKLPVPQQEQSSQDIAGIKWKLVELNGVAVQQQGDTPYYIELDNMNAFTGFAGCNKLRGHYEARQGKLRFMRIVGTMKGCPQLPTEEKFKTMLSTANNYVRNGKTLQFRDGENFIAKFEEVAK